MLIFFSISFLCVLPVIVVIVLSIRNEIVFCCRMRSLKVLSVKGDEAIKRNEDWRKYHDLWECFGSYDSQMWDFRKWTYKQFYPNWEIE